MLRNLLKTYSVRVYFRIRQFSSVQSKAAEGALSTKSEYNLLDTRTIPNDDTIDSKDLEPEPSVLEPCNEDISYVAPYLRPSFNFAAYVNKSETLQKLVQLGVELYKLEKNPDVPPYLLQLDFEKDIKNHIIFLTDLGLETADLGWLITKNPFIFKEDLDNLQVRINYLKFKKFNDEMILRIVQDNPHWLGFSTQEIDKKLGFFQKNFGLTGNEVRSLTVKKPRLITYNLNHVKLNTFVIREEMGFTPDETKQILLQKPKIFMKNQKGMLKTFEYLHKEMNIPLETIAKMPQVLTCREFRLQQRYLFLKHLGKIQFDPKQPNYISLIALVSDSDAHFATEVAGSSVNAFNEFLKTL
ncbi:transcription termination factor 3, mitochondrial [Tribolium castaneum]|uniref:Transcription termination factor 3, mitochondrial n=1 Tax=Tribolium castaneum TaxID=7070 RepID=D6WNW3_TRICA|nr:PREDICTED: transcription termination factor 3, mitochondrial [Tribolium castaneum]EFA03203.1 mTERF domain-containing protein 1, mitochondrial-like Protein [Tribolium castaneum]|eukprot:XP_974355.1 PREDICTED: transcription termination factor 3, mitochondrial [Tribolium castaneum]